MRRVLIDELGNPKGALSRGEQKSLQTDRVVLSPSPDQEQDGVRRMYRMFVEDGRSEREIAETLNSDGHMTDIERPRSRTSVHQVLTNEEYIGNNVYNKVSFKLKHKRVVNPRDMWIRAEGAYPAIVDEVLFLRARAIVDARRKHFTDAELLEALRAVLKHKGVLSGLIIDEQDNLPSSSAFRSRFGSQLRAYQMIGYEPERVYHYVEINRALRRAHPGIVAQIRDGIGERGGLARQDPETDVIRINDEFTASVVLARCVKTQGGSLRWRIRLDTGLMPDSTIAARMDELNSGPRDYYLLPRIDMTMARLRLGERNGLSLDAYRFDTLDYFYALAGRGRITEAA